MTEKWKKSEIIFGGIVAVAAVIGLFKVSTGGETINGGVLIKDSGCTGENNAPCFLTEETNNYYPTNTKAHFSIIDQAEKPVSADSKIHTITLAVRASDGIIPPNVCIKIDTDAEVSYVEYNGRKDGDKQTKVCFDNPPSTFTVSYDLESKPTFFNATVE